VRPDTQSARLPSLSRAQLLCESFELYRALLGTPALGFEHAVFLLHALLQAEEIMTAPCPDCQALVVVDRWALHAARCGPCAAASVTKTAILPSEDEATDLPVPACLCKTPRDGDFHERHL
jgi:hypothetical protein